MDEPLLGVLGGGAWPQEPDEHARCLRASNFMWIDEAGRLWARGRYDPKVEIPSRYLREELVRRNAVQLGFPDGTCFYQLMRSRFYWKGMPAEYICVARAMLPAQLESARFQKPRYLHPTEKDLRPLQVWVVDTIVGLSPPALDGSSSVVVATCPFSKFTEIARLPVLDARHTAGFLHEQVVCWYGLPSTVCTDRGTEYRGAFAQYCRSMGIVQRYVAA